jgi:hypothetical protein
MTTILQRENGPFRTIVSVTEPDGDRVHLTGTVELFGVACVNVTHGFSSRVPFWFFPDAAPVVALAAEVEHVAGRRFADAMCSRPTRVRSGAPFGGA